MTVDIWFAIAPCALRFAVCVLRFAVCVITLRDAKYRCLNSVSFFKDGTSLLWTLYSVCHGEKITGLKVSMSFVHCTVLPGSDIKDLSDSVHGLVGALYAIGGEDRIANFCT